MSSIRRLAKATTTWLIRAGLGNDLTTLSDRDLRDIGLVRHQIGINHQQVISVGNFLRQLSSTGTEGLVQHQAVRHDRRRLEVAQRGSGRRWLCFNVFRAFGSRRRHDTYRRAFQPCFYGRKQPGTECNIHAH